MKNTHVKFRVHLQEEKEKEKKLENVYLNSDQGDRSPCGHRALRYEEQIPIRLWVILWMRLAASAVFAVAAGNRGRPEQDRRPRTTETLNLVRKAFRGECIWESGISISIIFKGR